MQHTSFHFTGSDGRQIFARRWLPTDDKELRGCLQIAHGMAEHSGRYARLAERFTKAGFAVYANDHRGHGHTINDTSEEGHYADRDGWNLVIGDMQALNKHIEHEQPKLPRILLGHSMGSHMAQQYVIRHSRSINGLILSATTGYVGPLRPLGIRVAQGIRLLQGPRGKNRILDEMSFGKFNAQFKPNRTEYDWLSRDDAEVDAYINDPLCGFSCSAQLWIDLLSGMGDNERQSRRGLIRGNLPVLLITGSEDASNEGIRGTARLARAYEKVGLHHVDFKAYPGGRHEMLNETNRAEVTDDLMAWIEKTLSNQNFQAQRAA